MNAAALVTRGAACTASCRHRRFVPAEGDQATSHFTSALVVAALRVERRRCRQRVSRHISWWHPRGIWLVQDVDDAAAVTR